MLYLWTAGNPVPGKSGKHLLGIFGPSSSTAVDRLRSSLAVKQCKVGEGRGSLSGATWGITGPQPKKALPTSLPRCCKRPHRGHSPRFNVMLNEQGLCWNNFLDSRWSRSCPERQVSRPKLRQLLCSCKCPAGPETQGIQSASPQTPSQLWALYLLACSLSVFYLSLPCSLFFTL